MEVLTLDDTRAIPFAFRKDIHAMGPFCHIYTSGTTGLPKAAKVAHYRITAASRVMPALVKWDQHDVVYITMPLYHTSALLIGVSGAIQNGSSCALRSKFSKSKFFSDCAKFNCTIVQYIGELARYLLTTAPSSADRAHKVRLAIGNGMRADVWKAFIKRFKVKHVFEFYAATESNATLLNPYDKIGAVGYLSWIMEKKYPVAIAKYDVDSDKLVKDTTTGFVARAATNEPGELLGLINDADISRRFDGYSDAEATKKKIALNVFKNGDKWFRTGDLVKQDKAGFVYFVDRIGDTFRWKGHNVATGEVELVTNAYKFLDPLNPKNHRPAFQESTCYGVELPHNEGRAGMLLFVFGDSEIQDKFNYSSFYSFVVGGLPAYAVPVFLRHARDKMGGVELTSTFKHKKAAMQKQSYDDVPAAEIVYIIDHAQKTYRPLTDADRAALSAGSAQL